MNSKFYVAIVIAGILFICSCKKNDDNTVKDIDGNVYKTVPFGTRIWMAENLKTTKYSNGDLIGTTSQPTLGVSNELTPKFQWAPGGVESNVVTYGRLYTWYAVTDSRNICPAGWHVPADFEWTNLIAYLGGENTAQQALKDKGFKIQYAGWRPGTDFVDLGLWGYWWSTTIENTEPGSVNQAYSRVMASVSTKVARSYNYQKSGLAVVCVKD